MAIGRSPSPFSPARANTPSPRSQASTILPNRSIPDQPLDSSTKPSFVPTWRRPTLTPNNDASGRRPSVQFVPHAITGSTSRSSSAKPHGTRTLHLDGTSSSKRPSLSGRRMSSPPPPAQYRSSVSFDTFSNPSASEYSLTLNRKHRDYTYTKRSRTFLCGTDTNEYSDTALEWLIDELVDDGDEIVCLRVVEKDSKEAIKWAGGQGSTGYQKEAHRFLEAIEKKNTDDRAISLVLEFSIGKVHDTIQQMIRLYEPAILVVGTRGRSLTGYQGLLSSGSVSKYCLQYSPVPVIVVRPSSKREAKKRKRMQDPSRTGYRDILDKTEDAPRGRGGHLLDERNRFSVAGAAGGGLGLLGELGGGDPDEEARKVAEAIGVRPGRNSAGGLAEGRGSSLSRVTSAQSTTSTEDPPASPPDERLLKSPELRNLDSPAPSDSEDEGEDDDYGRGMQETLRPEDEAAMLAYERAQKVVEEEQEEAEAREKREVDRAARGGARSRSRGGRRESNEEGGGAAVLGLLAQLDRGMK
ncbi:hypothetical protein LTR78_001036 [Recurvomyces mirabilis]|uniref:UspA domain-containing protein n=1 Tax=Recurvomyces mirabilis TaxID=574656 RepID=A0AAE0WW97_9PEZI|nr:hypothetical protein LTR78_001036 [Recurvomyces mirabilis]KAK5159008.1 hypothetical protein LTS14_003116 [Recurvomyces mirabilis]